MKKMQIILALMSVLLAGCSHRAVTADKPGEELMSMERRGDTLHIGSWQGDGMAPFPFQKDNYQRDYGFLTAAQHTDYQGFYTYHELRDSGNVIVLESHDDDVPSVIYADMTDRRIVAKPNLRVGMAKQAVLKQLNVPLDRADFAVLEVEDAFCNQTTFVFTGDVLSRIIVQSGNQSIFNPRPCGPATAGTSRGWTGEKLFAQRGAEYMGAVCYVNERGDTVVPYGKYEYIGYDSIAPIGIVAKPKSGLVALNTRGEELFKVMTVDNLQPDDVRDGRFRIVDHRGLVGYADTLGRVVVQPQYQCALPFENGRAKVAYHGRKSNEDDEHWQWVSDEWFYIDLNGRKTE